MSVERVWNDETRNALRETLRWAISGQLRLAKLGQDEILQYVRAVYIDEEGPESEREAFVRFAADELQRAEEEFRREKANWPEETDSDRLDRVETALRERGILFWQASPCCDSCTGAELGDRIDAIDERYPGFRDRVRGYAFFIDQTMPESLADGADLTVYLAYGWLSPDGSAIPQEEYEPEALSIAREVCDCLRAERFDADWNGAYNRKIGVSLTWQRRTMLQ